MITKVYFANYEKVVFEGAVAGEFILAGYEDGAFFYFSDGTILNANTSAEATLGKPTIVHRGGLLDIVLPCIPTERASEDEDDDDAEEWHGTDTVLFNHGITFVYCDDEREKIGGMQ